MPSVAAPIHRHRGPPSYLAPPLFSRAGVAGLLGIAAAHIGLFVLLYSFEVIALPSPVAALMVQMIPVTPPAPPSPARDTSPTLSPPRPQPAKRKPAPIPKPAAPTQTPILTTQDDATGLASPAPSNKEAAPAPSAPPPSASAASATESQTQPRFDADYLRNPAPVYPALSRRMSEEGKVVLRVFIEPDGHPGQIELRNGSGWPRLDQAAQNAVWRWKFIPARRGEETIGAWVLVPVVFNLRG